MNGPTLALHGRAAATIVHLAGDPTMQWAEAAKAARAADNEAMAVLFDGCAEFTSWCQQYAELLAPTSTLGAGDKGVIDPPPPAETPEGPPP